MIGQINTRPVWRADDSFLFSTFMGRNYRFSVAFRDCGRVICLERLGCIRAYTARGPGLATGVNTDRQDFWNLQIDYLMNWKHRTTVTVLDKMKFPPVRNDITRVAYASRLWRVTPYLVKGLSPQSLTLIDSLWITSFGESETHFIIPW